MFKIYLAGPDVFFPDAQERFRRLERECAELGMLGIRPSDGGLSSGQGGTKRQIATRIKDANLERIRECDAMIANLNPFRGQSEPDSGTSFEHGFAHALGKPVAGYLEDDAFLGDKVARAFGATCPDTHGNRYDATYGHLLEEFDLPLNLMLALTASIHPSSSAALARLRKVLDAAATPVRLVSSRRARVGV